MLSFAFHFPPGFGLIGKCSLGKLLLRCVLVILVIDSAEDLFFASPTVYYG